MNDVERFVFETAGYLVIPDALTAKEAQACLEAAKRVHETLPQDQWRQIGNTFEQEPAFENLIDHPSVLPKARALFGDRFILSSSWCTMVPAGHQGGGWHQDGAGDFRRPGLPTPLIQLRIGYVLTDLSRKAVGNLAMIPGSHNTLVSLPGGLGPEDLPIAEVICAKPGTAVMFHQGVYHCGTPNVMDYNRFMIHMVYSPPWLIRSDRLVNSPKFLARLSPMRRALMGQWSDAGEPFHMKPLPFES